MSGFAPDWAVETWLLVLMPGFLAIYGMVKVLAKSLSDIQQTEKLRREVVKLRHSYNERSRQLAEDRGEDVADITMV